MRTRAFLLLSLAAACGGGGGDGSPAAPFALLSIVPANGTIGLDPSATISLTFTSAPDPSTLTADTLRLLRADGSEVATRILTSTSNPRFVAVEPLLDLDPDAPYRFLVEDTILSAEGVPLGADHEVCFITAGPVPTVRADQIVDLGDRLHVPHYLAQLVRHGGRVFVIGGFRSATEATDAVEEWDAATKTFRLLPARLLSPRAEFTATILADGRILVAGGVAAPGGPPLSTTELFHPVAGSSPGPPLLAARRWHAASRFRGTGVLVSGGFGESGEALDTLEILEGGSWRPHPGTLPEPTAQHLQLLRGFDDVYVTVGNIRATAARVTSLAVFPLLEGDSRLRCQALFTSDGRALVVAGDTRTIAIHDFDAATSWLANDLFFDRRGAHSLTAWGSTGRLYLAAGGFQITASGRALRSLELVEYLANPGGRPDAVVYTVTGAELPVPFAGHVGFNDPSGATVLAGGIGDGQGDHSRRVVMILDDRTTPPATCR